MTMTDSYGPESFFYIASWCFLFGFGILVIILMVRLANSKVWPVPRRALHSWPLISCLAQVLFDIFVIVSIQNAGTIQHQHFLFSMFDLWSAMTVLWMMDFAATLVKATERKAFKKPLTQGENVTKAVRFFVLGLIGIYAPALTLRMVASKGEENIPTYTNLSYMCVTGGSAGTWFYTSIKKIIEVSRLSKRKKSNATTTRFDHMRWLSMFIIACCGSCYLLAQVFVVTAPKSTLLRDIFMCFCQFCGLSLFVVWVAMEMHKDKNDKLKKGFATVTRTSCPSTPSKSSKQSPHNSLRGPKITPVSSYHMAEGSLATPGVVRITVEPVSTMSPLEEQEMNDLVSQNDNVQDLNDSIEMN